MVLGVFVQIHVSLTLPVQVGNLLHLDQVSTLYFFATSGCTGKPNDANFSHARSHLFRERLHNVSTVVYVGRVLKHWHMRSHVSATDEFIVNIDMDQEHMCAHCS